MNDLNEILSDNNTTKHLYCSRAYYLSRINVRLASHYRDKIREISWLEKKLYTILIMTPNF